MQRYLTFVVLFISISATKAQEVTERSSPLALARARYKDAYIKITYSQPAKNGREIFGKLVPYGQIWRTGANEATEILLTKNILINNQLLKAGVYTIFTIPNKDKWTVVINSDFGLFGSYNYNPKLDVFRFDVPVQQLNVVYEPLTIQIDQRNELANILIMWDNVSIAIPIKFFN
ncbi:DUF2911 domain-containing protein [Chryseosolibacter indicus]|uniref:DUF2911 domain-containing protein n=1 Tax=Chryseosolibacter indicus TaxID=2782351 RepID=A0ABS5VPR1_9BACT|nr:DUF2911 domain-containing protein [Chryseosolibacter indicus]MBT1703423.1 DUF2911 domain-containing protein [Chryseosolibacter indicus]